MKRKVKHGRPTHGPNELEQGIMSSVSRRRVPGLRVGYETERLKYVLEHGYIPDLVVTFRDGRKMYIEAKGYFRPEDQIKMRAVKNTNPELDIRMIFPKDNKLSKRHVMRYSDWCTKYGIPYHVGLEVPKEWLT